MKKVLFIFASFFLICSCKKEDQISSINLELKKELGDIWFADQTFRFINSNTKGDTILRLAKQMNVDTVYLKNNYKSLAVKSDRQNSKRIEEIIRQYGYPGKKLVGTPENRTAWIVIQHSKPEIIQKYLPLLRQAAKNGDLDMQSLSLTEDRNLMYQDKKQIYGSQFFEIDGKPAFWPIENPEKVEKLGKEAGFVQTLEEYGKLVYGKDFTYKEYSLDEIKKAKQLK